MRFVKTAENLFGLPQGFTRVEYLESSGSKYYIDTGYKANSTTKVEIKTQGQTWIFGGRTSVAVGDAFGICFNANTVALQFGSQSINYNQTGIAQQVSECVISQDGAYINGVLRASFTSETFSCPNNLYLFDINNNGVLGDGLNGKMWYCRIYDNGTLVRDYIPCVDPFGVACMYDLVGKKPYYNQGTGTFTAGRQIIPVEYLEKPIDAGIGNSMWINTGLKYFADFEVGVSLRESVSNTCLGTSTAERLERNSSTYPQWKFTSAAEGAYASNISVVGYHELKWKDGKIYADGVQLTTKAKTSTASAYPMVLFGIPTSETTAAACHNIIYFCKLWNPTDGTLARDFIPCKDENNVGFMFDTLSGTVYLNAGTGAFSVGENKYKTKLRLIKDNKLPVGYTQVEYLESNGTQRINTDVSVASGDNFNLIVKGAFTTLTGYSQFMGVNGGAYFGLTTTGYYSVGQATGTATGVLADTDNHIFDLNCTIGNNQTNILKIDGTSYSNVRNNSAGDVRLFDVLNSYACYFKMAGATVYKNNILVRDFVPALDPTGTPCIYDLVTKTPFYNQGTGTFSYGKPVLPMVRFIKDIVPREYAIVNYIESTGTQYIDTGIIGTEGVLSEIDVMKTTATTNECFLGTWNSGSARCWLAYAFSNKWYPGYGGTASDMVSVVQNSWTHIKTYITQVSTRKYFGYNINGTDYTLTGYFTSFTGQNTILIFAMNTNTGANYKAQGRVGVCKITKDGVLVRNFIPVIRRIDKVAGMWDTVTKQFFGNSGTGTFNYG